MSYTDPCRGDCGANHWADCDPNCSWRVECRNVKAPIKIIPTIEQVVKQFNIPIHKAMQPTIVIDPIANDTRKFAKSLEKLESEFYKLNVVWFLVAYLGIVSIFSIYSEYESTQELKKLKIENQLLIKQLNGKASTLERYIRDYPRTK